MRIVILVISACIGGCAGRPMYVGPEQGAPVARITFEYETDAIAGSIVRFSHMNYSVSSCTEAQGYTEEDYASIGTVDIGNPLVKSRNFQNVPVRAEVALNLRATMSPHGGYGAGVCWVHLNFVPNDQSSYVARANYARDRGCSVVVSELEEDGSERFVATEGNIACGRRDPLEWVVKPK